MNTGVTEVPEGKERDIESEKVFKDPMTNFHPTFDEKYYPEIIRKLTKFNKQRYKQNHT